MLRGVPAFIRSDNGPEFIAQAGRDWIAAVGARTACIEPGSPRDGGGSESSPGDCFPDDGLLRKRLGNPFPFAVFFDHEARAHSFEAAIDGLGHASDGLGPAEGLLDPLAVPDGRGIVDFFSSLLMRLPIPYRQVTEEVRSKTAER